MKQLTVYLLCMASLVGCASIDSVDTKGKNQNCVRECTGPYTSCVGNGRAVNVMGLIAQSYCADAFKACVKTCPDK